MSHLEASKERLVAALDAAKISDLKIRLLAARILENEMQGASVFWNDEEHEVELLLGNCSVIFTQYGAAS